MKIIGKKLVVGCAALALLGSPVYAGRQAFINMQKIFDGYYKTVQANGAFEQKKKDFQERLDILQGELTSMNAKIQETQDKANNDLLSDDARSQSRQELKLLMERQQAKDQHFQQFRDQGFNQLQQTRLQAEQDLIKDLSDFVKQYCRKHGYDLVYDVTGKSLNRMPVVLVYPKDQEITAQVLKAINQGHEADLAKAKAALAAIKASEPASMREPASGDNGGGTMFDTVTNKKGGKAKPAKGAAKGQE